MDSFSLPGFDVEQLLGFGGCGEVWRARSHVTGERVALKRLRVGDAAMELASHRELRREAALLATVQHEHVVRLHATVPTATGLVLVFDYAEGGSLASLLATRGALTAGEVVAVAAPLATALAQVHARGVVHGGITTANVMFDAAGKPLLADLGVAGLVGRADAEGPSDPASDVRALAVVCHSALTCVRSRDGYCAPLSSVNGVPPTLIEVIESAMNPDPRSRPDAAGFARALYGACTPRPVAISPAAPPASKPVPSASFAEPAVVADPLADLRPDAGRRGHSAPRHVRTRGRRAFGLAARRLAAPLLAAGLLAAAVLVGVAWAGRDRPAAASAQPAAAAPSSDPSWSRVMTALDAARDRAFADGDPDVLAGVYVTGSSAFAADRKTLAAMADAGQRARNLSLTLVSVEARAQTPTSVELLVRDTLPPYDIVDADGNVQRQPGRGERAWLVTLRATSVGGSWRIATIDMA